MTIRFLIEGLVQGVGYRYFVARRAAGLGIDGWTRNLPDGRVEVVARGEAKGLAELERALLAGPTRAQVSSVEKTKVSDELVSSKSFEIKP